MTTLNSTPSTSSPPVRSSQRDEDLFLSNHKQWDVVERSRNGNVVSRSLHRTYKFNNFDAAFEFMSKSAHDLIAVQDHHPRWQNTYNKVEVWLTTFDLQEQISDKDIQLATSLEALWVETRKD